MSIVKISHLEKSYGRNVIFNSLSLEIPENKFTVIVGESGSGKSTLLNIIGMLEDYEDGEYNLFGKFAPLANSKEALLLRRKRISYLFQNFALIEEDSIAKNLGLALSYSKLSLAEKRKKMRESLQTVNIMKKMETKVFSLSGGEKQRVAFAQALLRNSDLILADEPTGSLDEKNRNEIIRLLKDEVSRGKTVLVVSHDPYVVSQADYCIEIGRADIH